MGQQTGNTVKVSGLAALCLIAGGCNQTTGEGPSGSELCQAGLRDVIELELTAPDPEMVRLKQEFDDMVEDFHRRVGGVVEHPGYMQGGPEVDAIFAYFDETYADYFTENGYAEFTRIEWPNAFQFHETNLEYQLKPTGIYVNQVEIEDENQEFSAFNFTADADYSTRRDGGTYEFTGWALCSPEGKISHLTMLDLNNLYDRIQEDR